MITKQDRIRFGLYMVLYRAGVHPSQETMADMVNLMQFCMENVESELIQGFMTDLDMLDTLEGYKGMVC
jgi:hypothetical protein